MSAAIESYANEYISHQKYTSRKFSEFFDSLTDRQQAAFRKNGAVPKATAHQSRHEVWQRAEADRKVCLNRAQFKVIK